MGDRLRVARGHLAVLLAYLAIVIVVLRPPLSALGRMITAGTEPCDTVPFALSWALGWGASRIDALGVGWWDAPIFHPTPGAFALSEAMPLLALLTWPAHAVGMSLAGCTNLALFGTLVANGWFVRRWLLRLGTGPRLATIGGAIALMLPFVHQELGVLPLVVVWPLVWMITATVDLLRARRPAAAWRGAIELGVATVVGFTACAQLTLVTALLLPLCGAWWLRRNHLEPRMLGRAAVALLIAAAGIAPFALPQRATLEVLELRRSDRSQGRGAARAAQLWRVPWSGLLPMPRSMIAARPEDRAFDPGPLRVGFAFVGAATGLRRRRTRRTAGMLVTLVVGAIAFAVAPSIELGGWEPSETLADIVPGYDQIRAVFRAVVLAQLGVLALAMLGLRALQVRLRARRRSTAWVVAIAAVLLVELVPPPPRWTSLPATDAAWIAWLRDEAEPTAAIAWIPFAATGEVCDHEPTAAAMLVGLVHGHPLVNGYSSFFPPLHNRVSRAARMLPNGRGIVALRNVGTRYLVAPDGGPIDDMDAARRARFGLHLAFRDDAAGITVFALDPAVE